MPAPPPESVLVLCPMQIERRAVAGELGRAGLAAVHVVQTGIGRDAVLRALDTAATASQRPSLVVLAGACGGLRPTPDVPPIARVADTRGGRWISPLFDPAGVTLLGVDEIISTPAHKRELAASTGAAVVDMESHAFADRCEQLGLAWSVVRGVSDTPDEMLPAEVLRWVDPNGDTRSVRAAVDLVRRPRLLPPVIAVVRRSNRVLPQVGRAVADVVRRAVATPVARRPRVAASAGPIA